MQDGEGWCLWPRPLGCEMGEWGALESRWGMRDGDDKGGFHGVWRVGCGKGSGGWGWSGMKEAFGTEERLEAWNSPPHPTPERDVGCRGPERGFSPHSHLLV